jgi:phosphoglycolate phosphatase-like HAD superfamily hydrolase
VRRAANNIDDDMRAALDARLAVRGVASGLHPAATALQDATADNTHPAVSHLSSANG